VQPAREVDRLAGARFLLHKYHALQPCSPERGFRLDSARHHGKLARPVRGKVMFAKRFDDPHKASDSSSPHWIKMLASIALGGLTFMLIAVWAWVIGVLAHAF
jgi:hypothetical protein